MSVMAVDTGYSATKIYSEISGSRKTLIFPSVIGQTDFGEDFLGATEDNFIAELSLYPGKVRNFGETAIRLNRGGETSADRDMFTKHYNPALTLAGIARFMTEKQAPAPETLVVGLPVNFYSSQKQVLVDKLTGKHTVKLYKINGKVAHEVEFKLKDILVLPQGYGSFLSYALDREGKKIAERIVDTAVIDGGEKTIDIVAADAGGRYNHTYSKSIPSSLDAVYHDLQREIDARYDDYLERSTIESYIRSRTPYVTPTGETVDLEEMRRQVLEKHMPEIINRIQMTVRPMRPHKVLVAGGSGDMIFDGIKAVFQSAEKVESMIFSNAIGYYRYGLLRKAGNEA
ncbi:MAG TPA: ParM/StbA family protein [Blastocatellia bacterium]|nr:ParM/StbA family protein [Blastocatellia bacterium]